MLRRSFTIALILLVGIVSFILLNKTLDGSKEEQKFFIINEEVATLKAIIKKLHEKYLWVDVKMAPNKELVIQVVGDTAYLNSVKEDMELITREVIRTSVLNDYAVVFERWENVATPTEQRKIVNEVHDIRTTLKESFGEYIVFGDISVNDHKSITIHINLTGSDKDTLMLVGEIEEMANRILKTTELATYEIKILNAKGEVVN